MLEKIEDHITEILIALAVIVFIIMWFPRTYTTTINTVTWKSTVEIEKLKTFNESGWYLPSGARLDYKRREIRKYDDDDEPVYDTRYYYEIDRWCHERDVVEQGTTKTTYYGIVVFGENEREERRYMTYTITCTTDKGKTKSFTVDEMDFKELRSGDYVRIKTQFGHVTKLEYVKKESV